MVEFLGDGGGSGRAMGTCSSCSSGPWRCPLSASTSPKPTPFPTATPMRSCCNGRGRRRGRRWREVARTEVLVDTHNPKWVTKARLDVTPERGMDDELLVQVWAAKPAGKRSDALICQGVATVWDVCVAVGRCKVVALDSVNKSRESWLILTGDVVRDGTPAETAPVTVHVAYGDGGGGGGVGAPRSRRSRLAARLALGAADREKTFFVLNRGLPKARWTPVHRSASLRGGRGAYAPAVTTAGELWKGEAAAPARVEWWVERRGIDPKLLGFVHLSRARVEAVAGAGAGRGGRAPGGGRSNGLVAAPAARRGGAHCQGASR
eukprot:TRINITY_DN5849_c1_g1_i1.p1 TRINITY_DN5849_c1_g1~~TRINITY_DN5849_c1_g1_i1.p1  ORF type:complete len:321 (-),score=68.19 TRINITY_DN5849_c1_g1_i1:228-1190(-)